jgi:hypothetical protein
VDRGEEAMHCRGPAVFEGEGRHPHPRVVGHQRDERVDIAVLERLDQPAEQFLFGRRVRRRWLVRLGCLAGEGRPGPLERAGDRLLGGVQHLRDLTGREVEHVAQDQGSALPRREELQRRDERERDRFAGLVAGLRPGCRVGEVGEQHVGVGAQPDHFAAAGRLGRGDVKRRQVGGRVPPGRAQRVQAAVGGDPVQPRAEGSPALEPGQPPPSGGEGLLQRVLRVRKRAEEPVAVELDLSPVRSDQLLEGLLISRTGPFDELGAHSLPPRLRCLGCSLWVDTPLPGS